MGWHADQILALFIGEVVLPELVDRLLCDDGMVDDSSLDRRSTLAGDGLAEVRLTDTVYCLFVGNVTDHLRVRRTAFYRYFPPDLIRGLRNQA